MRFGDLLDAMGLIQYVKRPTHIHGHTLDLTITRQSHDIVAEEPIPERFISDHSAGICRLRTGRSVVEVKHDEYRKLQFIDSQLFEEDIRNSSLYVDPPDDLNTLVNCYNTTLKSLLDKHAPIQSRHIKLVPGPPGSTRISCRRDAIDGKRRSDGGPVDFPRTLPCLNPRETMQYTS